MKLWHALFIAAFALHLWKQRVEADALQCNDLIAKPPFSSILTCQKLYHYQPDPFTG